MISVLLAAPSAHFWPVATAGFGDATRREPATRFGLVGAVNWNADCFSPGTYAKRPNGLNAYFCRIYAVFTNRQIGTAKTHVLRSAIHGCKKLCDTLKENM
jgi:hypothetical protein